MQSCSKLEPSITDSFNNKAMPVSRYERMYVQNRCYSGTKSSSVDNGVFLFGYSKVEYHGDDSVFVSKLWNRHREEIEDIEGVYAYQGRVRIYCPLANAIVQYNERFYVADDNGYIADIPRDSVGSIKLVGRERTEHTKYTVFKGDYGIASYYENYGAAIFDLGIRKSCNKESQDKVEALRDEEHEGISCRENHGGLNCTDAFDLYQGRCPLNHNRCMDYNGFETDCKGSKLFFVGSDCCIAMALTRCWNEIMK